MDLVLQRDGADCACKVAKQVSVVRFRGMDVTLRQQGLLSLRNGAEIGDERTDPAVRIQQVAALPNPHQSKKGFLDAVPTSHEYLLVFDQTDAIMQRVELGRDGIDAKRDQGDLLPA